MHLEEAVITDYVDETLAPHQREGVERHLAECRECRRLIDDFREIRRIAGTLQHYVTTRTRGRGSMRTRPRPRRCAATTS